MSTMKVYYVYWDDEPSYILPDLYLSRDDAEAEAERRRREWVPPKHAPDWVPKWSVFDAEVILPAHMTDGSGAGQG